MQHAGTDIRNVDFIGGELEAVHKQHSGLTPGADIDGHYAGAAQGQVFLCQRMAGVALKGGINNTVDFIRLQQMTRNRFGIFAVLRHTDGQRFQPQVQQER